MAPSECVQQVAVVVGGKGRVVNGLDKVAKVFKFSRLKRKPVGLHQEFEISLVSSDDRDAYVPLTLDLVFQNLRRLLGGEPLLHRVDPDLGY